MVGQSESVVSSRGCYNPAPTLGRGELEERITGAALFEGSRALLVVEFAEYLSTGEFGQGNGFETGGEYDPTCDAACGRADRRKGYRHIRQASPLCSQVAKKRGGPRKPRTAYLPIAYTNLPFV